MGVGDLQSNSPTSNFAKQNCDQPLAPHGLIADLNLLTVVKVSNYEPAKDELNDSLRQKSI
jgi:hypothetical protein